MYKVFCRRCGYEGIGDSESDLLEKMQKHSIGSHEEDSLSEKALEDIKKATKT